MRFSSWRFRDRRSGDRAGSTVAASFRRDWERQDRESALRGSCDAFYELLLTTAGDYVGHEMAHRLTGVSLLQFLRAVGVLDRSEQDRFADCLAVRRRSLSSSHDARPAEPETSATLNAIGSLIAAVERRTGSPGA